MNTSYNLKELGSDVYIIAEENFTTLKMNEEYFSADFSNVEHYKIIGVEIRLNKTKKKGYEIIYSVVPKKDCDDYFNGTEFNFSTGNFTFTDNEPFLNCRKTMLFELGYNNFWFDNLDDAVNMAKKKNQNYFWIKDERYKEDFERLKNRLMERIKKDWDCENDDENEYRLRERIEAMF